MQTNVNASKDVCHWQSSQNLDDCVVESDNHKDTDNMDVPSITSSSIADSVVSDNYEESPANLELVNSHCLMERISATRAIIKLLKTQLKSTKNVLHQTITHMQNLIDMQSNDQNCKQINSLIKKIRVHKSIVDYFRTQLANQRTIKTQYYAQFTNHCAHVVDQL